MNSKNKLPSIINFILIILNLYFYYNIIFNYFLYNFIKIFFNLNIQLLFLIILYNNKIYQLNPKIIYPYLYRSQKNIDIIAKQNYPNSTA